MVRAINFSSGVTLVCAAASLLLVGAIFWNLASHAWPAISRFGFGFLTSTQWNPVKGTTGPHLTIYGTLVSTLIAMLLALPIICYRSLSQSVRTSVGGPRGGHRNRTFSRHSQYHLRHVGPVRACPNNAKNCTAFG